MVDTVSTRSRLIALLLCLFLGCFGAHRFYIGKTGTGVLMLLTLGGLGIWMLIDLILIAAGSLRDAEDRRVYNWLEPRPASV
jgi:TM2 domain-containing membrane protein YozV